MEFPFHAVVTPYEVLDNNGFGFNDSYDLGNGQSGPMFFQS